MKYTDFLKELNDTPIYTASQVERTINYVDYINNIHFLDYADIMISITRTNPVQETRNKKLKRIF
jgi:hypothetical protein